MNFNSTMQNLGNSGLVKSFSRYRDFLIVIGVIVVLIVMVIPIPQGIIDILLTLNLGIALIILLSSMYNREALDFSVFPSLLLTVTLFRLSLNVATTRLILGEADAGNVIEAFGTFVTKNNPVVGFIIFSIIVIIQFVVITKGAGRIAEVAARFTLDAMPGKQMAIDADLNAGIIDEQQAKVRREKVASEADFYGTMDGAAKFVRGDAIAAIIITLINIIGGFIIGVAQQGMSFPESLTTYTTLTIGDGLVSQIPALMISVGAGILVSRAASQHDLGQEITIQVFSNPRVLAISAGVMFFFALVPGLPRIPFIFLAILLGGMAFLVYKSAGIQEAEEERGAAEEEVPEDKPEDYLYVDPLELEIGYGLIPLVDASQGGDLLERITQIRKQLASELGMIIPPVRIRDNIQLKPNEYRIKIRTVPVDSGELMSGTYLAMNPGNVTEEVRGIKTVDPAFGLPAKWITESQKEKAELANYTVVELPAVLSTHLTEVIKRKADQLLTRQDVSTLIEKTKEEHAAIIDELVPDRMSVGEIHRVLQNLLRERVSIRDLPTILEVLSDVSVRNKNLDILTEYVRNALAPQICENYKNEDSIIPVITMDPNLEAKLESSLEERDDGIRLALPPSDASKIVEGVNAEAQKVKEQGELPIVLCSPTIRAQLKRLVEEKNPDIVFLSYSEIVSGIDIRSLGMIRFGNQNQERNTKDNNNQGNQK